MAYLHTGYGYVLYAPTQRASATSDSAAALAVVAGSGPVGEAMEAAGAQSVVNKAGVLTTTNVLHTRTPSTFWRIW